MQDTHRKILQAAIRLFTEQGYAATPTRQIAEEAGVNEVTLFRHFGSKEALFQEAIQANSAVPRLAKGLESEMTGDLAADLTRLGEGFFRTMLERRKAILMTLWEAERQPEIRPLVARIPAAQRRILSVYLQNQIEAGRIRPVNPETAAQAFLGMFMAYAINQALMPPEASSIPPTAIAEQFVHIFLHGIQTNINKGNAP
jgi:AcrR family transcriptional regulator